MSDGARETGIRTQKLIDGLEAKPPAGQTSFAVGGKVTPLVDLLATLRASVAPHVAVEQANQVRLTALATRTAAAPAAKMTYDRAVDAVKGALGRDNPALLEYGIQPEKEATPLTPEQLVVRSAKAKATNKARGNMSPKQRKAIKAPGGAPPTPTNP